MSKKSINIYPFRVFTILVLGFLVGVFISSCISLEFREVWLILLCTIAVLLFAAVFNYIYKNRCLTLASWTIIFVIFGLGYYSYFNQNSNVNLVFDQKLEIEGQIIKKVEQDYEKQKITLKILETSSDVDMTGVNILINAPHYPKYRYGDIVRFSGEIVEPGEFDNFDYGTYLRRYLTFGVVYRPENFQKTDQVKSIVATLIRGLYSLSDAFEKSLNKILPEPHASLASGLILGVKRNIPSDFLEALNVTGLTHIIALSGYNVTIIIAALSLILLPKIGRKKVFWLGFLFVVAFVILTGAASSVVRAAIFSMFIIYANTIGRRGDQINLMLLAAFIMVIKNPFVLRDDLGFQLSFVAFSGLVFISPILERIFENKNTQKIPDVILLPLRETLSAQIAVTPLILLAFGRISFIAPLSNLLVLWIIPLAMGLVFVAGLGGIIYYHLGKILAYMVWPVLEYIVQVTKFLSKTSYASGVYESNLIVMGLVLYAVLTAAIILFKRQYKIIY